MLDELRPGKRVHAAHAPDVSKQGWRQPESDDVSQGVEFAPEGRSGIGEAGDAPVQAVEEDGPADGLGRVVKRHQGLASPRAGRHHLPAAQCGKNGEVTADQRSYCEEAGEKVDAAANSTPVIFKLGGLIRRLQRCYSLPARGLQP